MRAERPSRARSSANENSPGTGCCGGIGSGGLKPGGFSVEPGCGVVELGVFGAIAVTGFLAEAFRIARPGGRVLLLDLSEHREAWVQNTLGDRWLGFDEDTLRRLP